MQSSYFARALVVTALTVGASTATAQGVTALTPRDATPPYPRTHSIGTSKCTPQLWRG